MICAGLPPNPGKDSTTFVPELVQLIRLALAAVWAAVLPGNQTAYRAPSGLPGLNCKVSWAAPRRL